MPSSQDGSSIRVTHGPVCQEIKRIKNEGYTSAAMMRSEMKENYSKGILHMTDQKKMKLSSINEIIKHCIGEQ